MTSETTSATEITLRCTALYGGRPEPVETLTYTLAEFEAENEADMESPEFQRVLFLRPGESTVLDFGAGGAWEVRRVAEEALR